MASGFRGVGMPLNYVPRPRAPPRLIRPPTPLSMERPQPIVPDVSLIIDSAATSFHSNVERSVDEGGVQDYAQNQFALPRHVPNRSADNSQGNVNMNFANYYPTPPENVRNNDGHTVSMSHSRSLSKEDSGNGSSSVADLSHNSRGSRDHDSSSASENLPLDDPERSFPNSNAAYDSLKADIATVMKTVNSQSESIQMLNLQLQKIVTFQDKFLAHMVRKGSLVSKCVQTEDDELVVLAEVGKKLQNSVPARSGDVQGNQQAKRSVVNSSEKISPPLQQNNPKRVSPSMRQELLKNKVGNNGPVPPDEKRTGGEDLSVILRNLQISNVNHPSTYSDTSMPSIECPPFNETFQHENSSLGPSASAHGSDEEDSPETVFPSVTYYNNLLSTVNRILDGGQKPSGVLETNKTPSSSVAHNNGQVIRSASSSSSSSKRKSVKNMVISNSKKPPASPEESYHGTVSYSSGSSSSEIDGYYNEGKENCPPRGTGTSSALVNKYLEQQQAASNSKHTDRSNDCSVESTKKYLQSLGIQFDSPGNPPQQQQQPTPPMSQKQNYMIQQNVYNSIYIPTVNCVPVISESLNSNSGLIDNLARKYIPSGERNQYEMMAGKNNEPGAHAETTVYGMTPGNLSFATKEYLKRHGLVGHTDPPQQPAISSNQHLPRNYPTTNDKVLDITAIRNQPKLL